METGTLSVSSYEGKWTILEVGRGTNERPKSIIKVGTWFHRGIDEK